MCRTDNVFPGGQYGESKSQQAEQDSDGNMNMKRN